MRHSDKMGPCGRAIITTAVFAVACSNSLDFVPPLPTGDSDELFVGLGQVAVVSLGCQLGGLPRSSCLQVEVRCRSAGSIRAEIRYTPPPVGVPIRGTVVFGTGGGGIGFVEDDDTDADGPVAAMLAEVTEMGFAVVQRRWANMDADGWFTNQNGMFAASCRYATLVTWIWQQYHRDGPFCAVGYSAGSAEIAYALARWSRGRLIDFAMLNSGPPLTRIDWGCLGESDDTWQEKCAGYDVPGTTCETLSCTYDEVQSGRIDASLEPRTPCADRDDTMTSRFLLDSIAAPGAAYDFPQTPLHFFFGDRDCGVAVPMGLAFADLVVSEKRIDVVAEADHMVLMSENGRDVVPETLRNECVRHH